LSIGILIQVQIPFQKAQELDKSLENSELAIKISEIIMALKEVK
jgi:hypothetical protein